MYRLRSEMLPSMILVSLGCIDCLTTVIGVLYFGAAELNPFLAGIVSNSVVAFLALKLLATFFIGSTYVMAKRMLSKTENKDATSYGFSSKLLKGAFAGLTVFLALIVTNNVLVLLFEPKQT